jgi:hypothetical protein
MKEHLTESHLLYNINHFMFILVHTAHNNALYGKA